MSELLDLQEMLRDTSAAIAQAEQAILQAPESASVAVMLRSFEKRRQVLEEQFQRKAMSVGTDACSYRFLSEAKIPAVKPLCEMLGEFQSLYSLVYDAIKHGAKKRTRKLPQDVVDETSFTFGYSFSGSVGIVLTFDNDRRELFGTDLDDAMESVFALATAKSPTEVLEHGQRLGVPAVRAVHKWATISAESGFGADIQWKKGHQVSGRLLMQVQEMAQLATIISGITEVVTEQVQYVGKLTKVDTDKRSFILKLPDGTAIRGKFSDQIPQDPVFAAGAVHTVTLDRRVRVYYATEKEENVTYKLVAADVYHKPG